MSNTRLVTRGCIFLAFLPVILVGGSFISSWSFTPYNLLHNLLPRSLSENGDCTHVDPTLCEQCPNGTYANYKNLSCACCYAGMCNTTKACTECSVGHYQDKKNKTACIMCPPGTATNETGSALCTECNAGHYANISGKVVCLKCKAGAFSNSTGSTGCTLCQPGHYQDEDGQTSCEECVAGTFSILKGAAKCLPCERGHYGNETGETVCAECQKGTYNDKLNATKCPACEFGHYQPLTGQPVCNPCSKGSYCNVTGCINCEKCPGGYESTQEGALTCTPCEKGHYKPETSSGICVACPAGWYQLHPAQVKCSECQEGFFCPCPTCLPQVCPGDGYCPPGSYQPVTCESALFTMEGKQCEPTAMFYVIICISSLAVVAVGVVGFYQYWKKRKQSLATVDSEEITPLIGEKKDPVYTGL